MSSTTPYGIRLLVGAAATVVEQTRKLPHTLLESPAHVLSYSTQALMHLNQKLAQLAIKGDSTLEELFPHYVDDPQWATFDEASSVSSHAGAHHDALGSHR